MEISDRLRALRESLGYTQSDVAARSGLSAPVVSKIESGRVDLRVSTVIRYLEQRCPSLPCAKKLIAHKNDWANLPINSLRADLESCTAKCE